MKLMENPIEKPVIPGRAKTQMQKIFEKFAMLVCWGEFKDQKDVDKKDLGLLSVEPVYNTELRKWQVVLCFETKTGTLPIATMLTENEARKFKLVEDPKEPSLMQSFYTAMKDHFKKYFPSGKYSIDGWNKVVKLDEFDEGVEKWI